MQNTEETITKYPVDANLFQKGLASILKNKKIKKVFTKFSFKNVSISKQKQKG